MPNPENSSSSSEKTPKPDIERMLAEAKDGKKIAIQEAKADIDKLEMYEKLPPDDKIKKLLKPFSYVQRVGDESEFTSDFLTFKKDDLGKNFRELNKEFIKNLHDTDTVESLKYNQVILYIMGPFFHAFNNPVNYTKDKIMGDFLASLVTTKADDGESLIYDGSAMEKAHYGL